MGIKASWIAVRGVDKAEALERLGLIDTGEPVDENNWLLSYTAPPTGWLIILRPSFEEPDQKDMAALSVGGQALVFALSETVMCSVAQGYADGVGLWTIDHDGGDKGVLHLQVTGAPPPEFPAIRDRLMAVQAEEGDEEGDVDHVFTVAPELSYALCGFRADGMDMPGGWPPMTLLREVVQPRAPGGGLFKSLAGLFKRA